MANRSGHGSELAEGPGLVKDFIRNRPRISCNGRKTFPAQSAPSESTEAAMNTSRKLRILIVSACLGPALYGSAVFAAPAGAQDALSPATSGSDTAAVSALPGEAALTDGELAERVQAALHAAPYFYDKHVTVAVEHGVVVLRGFVFSGRDQGEAIRIASKAAGDRRVIDNLSIKQGGRR